MNSKIDQLENQPDLMHELTEFFKNCRKSKEDDKETTLNENKNKLLSTSSVQSTKLLREKINIEIDLVQRTTVFSNVASMWI